MLTWGAYGVDIKTSLSLVIVCLLYLGGEKKYSALPYISKKLNLSYDKKNSGHVSDNVYIYILMELVKTLSHKILYKN